MIRELRELTGTVSGTPQYMFLCGPVSGALKPNPPEVIDVKWVAYEDLYELKIVPYLKDFLLSLNLEVLEKESCEKGCDDGQSIKIDYAPISRYYDETRVPLLKDVLEFYLSKIADLGKISDGSAVLDVGCGTGIYTVPLAEKTCAVMFGLDSSSDMIKKAKMKESIRRVEWVVGDAENLPFNSGCFDFVFMTLVIYQIVGKRKAVGEMYRVLKMDGRLVVMTKSHGQLKRSVIADFPKTIKIDLARFPSIPMLKNMVSWAGFRKAWYHVVSDGTIKLSVQDELEKTRKKFISTLTLLSDEDFKKGLKIFEKRLREKWGDEIIYKKENTFVVGEK